MKRIREFLGVAVLTAGVVFATTVPGQVPLVQYGFGEKELAEIDPLACLEPDWMATGVEASSMTLNTILGADPKVWEAEDEVFVDNLLAGGDFYTPEQLAAGLGAVGLTGDSETPPALSAEPWRPIAGDSPLNFVYRKAFIFKLTGIKRLSQLSFQSRALHPGPKTGTIGVTGFQLWINGQLVTTAALQTGNRWALRTVNLNWTAPESGVAIVEMVGTGQDLDDTPFWRIDDLVLVGEAAP